MTEAEIKALVTRLGIVQKPFLLRLAEQIGPDAFEALLVQLARDQGAL